MKQIIFTLLICIPFATTFATGKVESIYLNGAVPMVNGTVAFCKSTGLP